jgi:hypothetical protein
MHRSVILLLKRKVNGKLRGHRELNRSSCYILAQQLSYCVPVTSRIMVQHTYSLITWLLNITIPSLIRPEIHVLSTWILLGYFLAPRFQFLLEGNEPISDCSRAYCFALMSYFTQHQSGVLDIIRV